MLKYYCNCLNICVQLDEECDRLDEYHLSDEEKQSDFFQQLPLVIVQKCVISEEHTALIQLTLIGSWIVHRCTHCSVYTHAARSDESTKVIFVNGSLKKLTDQESEIIKKSSEYSPLFKILVADLLYPKDHNGTSHLPSETSHAISELKGFLTEKLDERKQATDIIIKKFIQEQENALKDFVKRANEDFLTIKSAVLSNYASEPKMQVKSTQEIVAVDNSVIPNLALSASSTKAEQKNKERSDSTSFDSEGLFLLDGIEDNNVLEDEDHSEEDLSDTDDSGSRDEGIHIPRRRTVAIARSLPIRVRADFGPTLRLFDDRFNDDSHPKGKSDYRRKMRNERPVDIAASMKALAMSVHGDTIFGDLPPPRIGSRI